MQTNYWNCPYANPDYYWENEDSEDAEQIQVYGCTHPLNPQKRCELENKFAEAKDNCLLLDSQTESETDVC
jgi:hypothetical protein